CSPFGTASRTTTLVASFGPLLVTVTVKVTTSPTLGRELFTTFVTSRSACCGVTSTEAESFVWSGSNSPARNIAAVLVTGLAEDTRAVTVNVTVAPAGTTPTSQRPVVALYVPWVGVAVRNCTPDRS